ncbi:unnamed protein product [Tilletia controversa]|uniref:Nitronate monooxygenase domain-containing protein n=3 Tax=Tilletia TaxID=13289 RepID=A0A8X7MZ75_9BASI|nr:hypothetical protein CF336_g1339 [Tilletia laevis]KAE8203810.1 hypothetical protein CF328_g1438 [Tilletia controversa]KAE8264362.1 hypothetical protein A4X03_0g1003 [Tilletia caries]KAE8207896.1 hypothetical protein CF335_g812 [Tilletia laevis]KAE8253216.1 hypothetical protein A4X06_0g1611 [Tilletia controversa]
MPFNNDLTRLLKITSPIVLGPMAGASGAELAAATTLGGGFGLLGAGYWAPDTVKDQMQTARALIEDDDEFAGKGTKTSKHSRQPFGIGFLVWRLSKAHSDPVSTLADVNASAETTEGIYSPAVESVEAALRARPKAIWLSFGEPEHMVAWADFIRRRDAQLSAELRAEGESEDEDEDEDPLVIMVGVGNEEQARHAVESVGCDILAVTGNEAGGHGLAASPSLFTLFPRVAHILPSLQPRAGVKTASPRPILIGAGGLASGYSLAALLALGAQGAVFGTRYLLTPEATYTPAQKDLLQSLGDAPSSSSSSTQKPTGDNLTLRTMAFDDARNTLDWPAGVDGRGVRNETVREYERDPSDASQQARQKRFAQAAEEKDVDRLVTWAGTGVGVMHEILPARELTRRLTQEAEEALRSAQSQIV